MSQLSPLPLEAPTPKQATEVNRDEAAHALSRACSGLLRQTGKWLANDVSTDHNIDPGSAQDPSRLWTERSHWGGEA